MLVSCPNFHWSGRCSKYHGLTKAVPFICMYGFQQWLLKYYFIEVWNGHLLRKAANSLSRMLSSWLTSKEILLPFQRAIQVSMGMQVLESPGKCIGIMGIRSYRNCGGKMSGCFICIILILILDPSFWQHCLIKMSAHDRIR